jgi:hypothetical protein
MRKLLFCLALGLTLTVSTFAQDKPDEEVTKIIRKYGLDQSKVMETASWLTDVYGPRLTGSPMLDKATAWAQDQLKAWGMQNVHTEKWGPFGRGWEFSAFSLAAISPNPFPIIAYPKAWSPSVSGTADVVIFDPATMDDLGKYKGKLAGKVVFIEPVREVKDPFTPDAIRHDAKSLLDLANAASPAPRVDGPPGGFRQNNQLGDAKWAMLTDEKPLLIVDRSSKGDLGTVFVSGARAKTGRAQEPNAEVLPQATMSVEHYNRIIRMIQKGVNVKVNVNLVASYANPDGMEANIIAEIPGADLKDEVVMFGAHFDSWHTGTGATDNGAGSAVMMEAARILLETIKETGKQPRRTLRIALWTGEEQGLFGSRGYVADHYAVMDGEGFTARMKSVKPEQEKVAGYFNLDNGTGKIRGVYLQGNDAAAPIFRAWLQPFKDLDASTLSMSNTGGTDHLAFDGVGIPGFQFIQEPMAYGTRTHHSNMDNYDHLNGEDLKQAATIIASFVWNTSQRDQKLPRKPLNLPAR